MNKSMVRSIFGFLVAIVLGITGCGGGGGGGESSVTTPTGTVVNLQSFRNVYVGTTAGAQFSFPLTGSDSQGNTWFGSLTMTADGPMVYDGQNVTRRRTLTTLGITGHTPISSVSTAYWLAADGSAYKSINDSGVVYTPTSSFVFPATAQVGDYGTFPEIIGNDGTSIQGTWALKAGTNGSSMLEIYAINKTGTTVTATELDTYYLDTAGVPTRIKIIATFSGITVTLTGDETPTVTSTETFQLKTAYINTLISSSLPFTVYGTISGVTVTGSGTATESGLIGATFEGSSCYNQITTIAGTITGNGTTIPYGDSSADYYDSNYNYLGSTGSEYTVVNGVMTLPLTAKVNDTGVIFTETIYPSSLKTYSTGTYTLSFILEPDTATTALLKLIRIERDTYNAEVSTSISVIRITPSGTFTRLYETYVSSDSNLRVTY